MAFIASNSSAGSQGKDIRQPGYTPDIMPFKDYLRNMSNAFDDFKIAFKKTKKRKRHKKAANLFLRHKKV